MKIVVLRIFIIETGEGFGEGRGSEFVSSTIVTPDVFLLMQHLGLLARKRIGEAWRGNEDLRRISPWILKNIHILSEMFAHFCFNFVAGVN